MSLLDILNHRITVQARIGYLPENTPRYPELSVQAYLQMVADLRRIPKPDQRAATDLLQYLNRPIGKLSKGTKQRVGLAQAILHKPKLLILAACRRKGSQCRQVPI